MFRQPRRFTIALENNRTVLLWTSTGLSGAGGGGRQIATRSHDLRVRPEGNAQSDGVPTNVMRCEMGRSPSTVSITFSRRTTPDVIPGSRRVRDGTQPPLQSARPERGSTRVAFQHYSSRVVAAAIWDDSLWVRDANRQVWRYS